MELDYTLFVLAPIIGFVGMLSGGYWGVGSGWITVPVLMVVGVNTVDAVGIGLLQMMPSALFTVWKQAPEIGWKRGSYGPALALPICIAAALTSPLGRLANERIIATFHSERPVQVLIVCMVGAVCLETLLSNPAPERPGETVYIPLAQRVHATLWGFGTGVLSSMMGVGGGLLFRPLLIGLFRVPESVTGRIVRMLVLTTSTIGGGCYLFSGGRLNWNILLPALLMAIGGMPGFRWGASLHHTVHEAGFDRTINRSFGVVAGMVVLATALNLCDCVKTSRILVIFAGIGVAVYIVGFAHYAKRRNINGK